MYAISLGLIAVASACRLSVRVSTFTPKKKPRRKAGLRHNRKLFSRSVFAAPLARAFNAADRHRKAVEAADKKAVHKKVVEKKVADNRHTKEVAACLQHPLPHRSRHQ